MNERLAVVGRERILVASAIFEAESDIANAGEARALNEWPFGFIDDFINPAGLEAAGDFQLDQRQLAGLLAVADVAADQLPVVGREFLVADRLRARGE